MIKDIICFNENGAKIAQKLNSAAKEAGIECANPFFCNADSAREGFESIGLDDFARRGFSEGHALIFVGAAGIATRAIAPYIKDKLLTAHFRPMYLLSKTALLYKTGRVSKRSAPRQ